MVKPRNANRGAAILLVTLFFCSVIGSSFYAYAFQVPALPEGNLLTNPWFRAFDDPNDSALDGWTDAAGPDRYWSSSQKASNPSPDVVVSGLCGHEPVHCGTAGRLSLRPGQSGGVAEPGVDAYLYQVVAADPAKRKLKFFTHWVSHVVDPAEVVIYGSQGPAGPWNEVWVPFHVVELEASSEQDLWTQTNWLEKIIPQGFPYYKIEIHARLPEDEIQVGFKITGIYFAVVDANSNEPTPTTGATPTPSATPRPDTTATPSLTPPPGVTVTPSPEPSPTATSKPGREMRVFLPFVLTE